MISSPIDGSQGPSRERGLAEKYSNQGRITTLMLRNIPSKYTQDMLLEELVDCMGSSDIFDFFYLPWDQHNDCNIGYAFVNFRTVQAAERCIRIFTDFSFRRFDSSKICKVYPAHIQGLENNVLHLMDRAVSEARSHYPIIVWKGEKIKLGKVIAAIDEHRRGTMTMPASTPGVFSGGREASLMPAGSRGGGMNMEGLARPWTTNDVEDYFAGAGDEDEGTAANGSRDLKGEGSRQGRPPPGLADTFISQALPDLLAAVQARQQACPSSKTPWVQRPPSRQGEGALSAAAGLGLLSPSSKQREGPPSARDGGALGLQQDQEVFSPSSGLGGSPLQPAQQPGRLQAPGSWHSMTPYACSLQPPLRMPLGALPPHASPAPPAPGAPGPFGAPPGTPKPGPFPAGPLQSPSPMLPTHLLPEGAADGQGCVGAAFSPHSAHTETSPLEVGFSPGGMGSEAGLRTIELRNPDDDVLSKFLGRFGT